MPLRKRCEGVYLKHLPGFRKIFPHMMPTRTEATIYYAQRVRLAETLAWLERFNAGRAKRISVFHVILAAGVRTLALRPEANRFVAGRRIYQRKSIDMAFIIKRELTEASAETNLKLTFDPKSTIFEVIDRVAASVKDSRAKDVSSDEKLTDLLTKGPRWLTRLLTSTIKTLDYFNSLPKSFVRGDAFFSSAYLANLGSIGLDAVFHHMFEFGNSPFFIVIGKPKKVPAVSESGGLEVIDALDMNISLDERVNDGVHYAKTIALLTDLIEHPSKMEAAPENLPDPFRDR